MTKKFRIWTEKGDSVDLQGDSFAITQTSAGKVLKIKIGPKTKRFEPDEWQGFTEVMEEIKFK